MSDRSRPGASTALRAVVLRHCQGQDIQLSNIVRFLGFWGEAQNHWRRHPCQVPANIVPHTLPPASRLFGDRFSWCLNPSGHMLGTRRAAVLFPCWAAQHHRRSPSSGEVGGTHGPWSAKEREGQGYVGRERGFLRSWVHAVTRSCCCQGLRSWVRAVTPGAVRVYLWGSGVREGTVEARRFFRAFCTWSDVLNG